MNQDEIKLVDECIEAYERMIKRFRQQIIDLHRQKMNVTESCPECFHHEFKIVTQGDSDK